MRVEVGRMGIVEARVTIWQRLSVGTTVVEPSLALETSAGCPGPRVSLLYYYERTWGWGLGPGTLTLPLNLFLLLSGT